MATIIRSPLLAGLGLSLATLIAGCHRGDDMGVRTVEAKIDGITCPSCVPPLTKSLQRRFKQADVTVDDDKDTATLQLRHGQAFSPAEFRQAVADVRMRIVTVNIQACGRAESAGGDRVLQAGDARFVLRGGQAVPLGQPICVSGRLDASRDPAVLEIGGVSPMAAAAGS